MIKTNAKEVARRLERYGEIFQDNEDEVVRQVLADIAGSLSKSPDGEEGTPRDTRRATNNWNPSAGRKFDFSDIGEGTHPEPKPRERTLSKIPPGSQAGNIANGTEYIGKLDSGTSKQAPQGFVNGAIKTGLERLRNVRFFTRGSAKGR